MKTLRVLTVGAVLFVFIFVGLAYPWTGGYVIQDTSNVVTDLSAVQLADGAIKVDANSDGDVDDVGDYAIYNEIWIISGVPYANVKLVYSIEPDARRLTPNIEDFLGNVIEIRGEKYLITDVRPETVKIGKAIARPLPKMETAKRGKFTALVGDIKIGLIGSMGVAGGDIFVLKDDAMVYVAGIEYQEGTDLTSSFREATKGLDGFEALDDYEIFLTAPTEIALTKKGELTFIENGQRGIFGYDEVRIDDEDFQKGTGRIKFLSGPYRLEKGESKRIEDVAYGAGEEPYKLQFNTRSELRVWKGYFPIGTTAPATSTIPEWRGLYIGADSNKIRTLTEAKVTFGEIKVDSNRDSDISDPEDYLLYDELWVLSGKDEAQVRLCYSLSPPEIDDWLFVDFKDFKGEVVRVGGKSYLITDVSPSSFELGEVIEHSVGTLTKYVGDATLSLEKDPTKGGSMGVLKIMKGETEEGRVNLDALGFENKSDISAAVHEASNVLDDHTVFVTDSNPRDVKIGIAETAGLLKVSDGDENVLGYAIAYVNSGEIDQGSKRLKFMSKLYTLEKDTEVEVEGSKAYTIKFNRYDEIKIAMGSFSTVGKRRVIVVANTIDSALASEFFGFLRNGGIEVVVVDAGDFAQYREERSIIILGGPDAPEGIGEIAREVLMNEEQNSLRTKGARKKFVKTNVWNRGQRVFIIAGSNRYQTQNCHVEHKGDVASEVE